MHPNRMRGVSRSPGMHNILASLLHVLRTRRVPSTSLGLVKEEQKKEKRGWGGNRSSRACRYRSTTHMPCNTCRTGCRCVLSPVQQSARTCSCTVLREKGPGKTRHKEQHEKQGWGGNRSCRACHYRSTTRMPRNTCRTGCRCVLSPVQQSARTCSCTLLREKGLKLLELCLWSVQGLQEWKRRRTGFQRLG